MSYGWQRERRRQARVPARTRTEQRTKVGDEAIVSGEQLVELTAGRGVLILEAVRLSGGCRAERAVHDRLVDRGELVARAGKEADDRGDSRGRCSLAADGRSRIGTRSPVSRL